MFEVVRSFFLDGATFKRVVSDVALFAGAAATTPEVHTAVAGLFPGAGWLPAAMILVSGVYSARARQKQLPPGV